MARRIREESLQAIAGVVRQRPEGMTAPQIADALNVALPFRTLQYRLKALVDDKRLIRDGSGRWTRYRLSKVAGIPTVSARLTAMFELSEAGEEVRDYVRQPSAAREPVGYDRNFLDCYHPNVSFYLSDMERQELWEFGGTEIVEQPAGTFAKQVLNRLLIDLSWNSSRLEGNTYSLLDTTRPD